MIEVDNTCLEPGCRENAGPGSRWCFEHMPTQRDVDAALEKEENRGSNEGDDEK